MACTGDFEARAHTDEFAEFTLKFGPKWHGPEVDNDPIPRSRTTVVDFYIKNHKDDTEYVLHLSDADDTEIKWINVATGEIEVYIGANITNEMAGIGLYWEVKVSITDGTRQTAGYGTCDLLASLENDA